MIRGTSLNGPRPDSKFPPISSTKRNIMENENQQLSQILAELKQSNRHLNSCKWLLGITIALCVVMALLDVVISGIAKH
jgi:hypothetical protein